VGLPYGWPALEAVDYAYFSVEVNIFSKEFLL